MTDIHARMPRSTSHSFLQPLDTSTCGIHAVCIYADTLCAIHAPPTKLLQFRDFDMHEPNKLSMEFIHSTSSSSFLRVRCIRWNTLKLFNGPHLRLWWNDDRQWVEFHTRNIEFYSVPQVSIHSLRELKSGSGFIERLRTCSDPVWDLTRIVYLAVRGALWRDLSKSDLSLGNVKPGNLTRSRFVITWSTCFENKTICHLSTSK